MSGAGQEDIGPALERKLEVLAKQQAAEITFRTAVEARLTSIEETLRWLVRLVLGTFSLFVLTFVIHGGF